MVLQGMAAICHATTCIVQRRDLHNHLYCPTARPTQPPVLSNSATYIEAFIIMCSKITVISEIIDRSTVIPWLKVNIVIMGMHYLCSRWGAQWSGFRSPENNRVQVPYIGFMNHVLSKLGYYFGIPFMWCRGLQRTN